MATIASMIMAKFLEVDQMDEWTDGEYTYNRYVTPAISGKLAGYKVVITQGLGEAPLKIPEVVSEKVVQEGALGKKIEIVTRVKRTPDIGTGRAIKRIRVMIFGE